MADSLDEQIVDLVATKLATITTGAGYSMTVAGVYRPPTCLYDLTAADCPFLILRRERKESRWHIRGAEEFLLVLEVLAGAASEDLVANLIGDVKKLVEANRLWNDGANNLAIRSRFVGDSVHEVEVTEDFSSGVIHIEIQARADLDNPTQRKVV